MRRSSHRTRHLMGAVTIALGLLLSVGPAGAALPAGPSTEHTSAGAGTSGGREAPAISADGTRVVYVGRGSADQGLWLTDRDSGTIYRLTTGSHFNPDISADGNTVAYVEYGSTRPIYIRDITDPANPGPAILVSKSTSGEAANGLSDFPSLNQDGTVVAFQSMATNLDPATPVPTSGGPNKVYVRDLNPADRTQGTTGMVSVDNSGAAQPGNGTFPDLSDTGRYVAFASEADLSGPAGLSAAAEEETTTFTQIWLRDRTAATTTAMSVADDGTVGNGASATTYGPKVSGDGAVVSFESDATNLVPADTNGHTDAFEHHVAAATTTRVSERTPTTELGAFHALTPTRLLDTREDPGTRLAPGQAVELTVVGGDVPADAAGVALNVTVTEPTGPGFLTVYPSGTTRPVASSINWNTGWTVANAVTVKVGAGGAVTIYNHVSSATHVVVDLAGWYDDAELTSGGGFFGIQPSRVLDTRNAPGTPVAPGQTITVPVVGGDVPITAQAVALSVTVTQPSGPGFLTVFPSDATQPTASNLNFVGGQTVANSVLVSPGPDGAVKIYNHQTATAHVVVDVDGWFDAALPNGGLTPVDPVRALDTRSGSPLGTNSSVAVKVLGVGAVPTDNVTSVALNVTVTEPTAPSYLTVFPTGTTRPTASNLNFVAGETRAVQVLAQVGAAGEVSIYNLWGAAHVVVDITGWYSGVQVSEGGLGAVVSSDGAHVAFESLGTTMTPGDVNGVKDVFVRDLGTSLTERLSVVDETLGGTEATGTRIDGNTGEVVPQVNGYDLAVSGDGSMASFVSNGNLTNDRTVDEETGGISTEPATFTRTRD